jgi:cell division protein FtsB
MWDACNRPVSPFLYAGALGLCGWDVDRFCVPSHPFPSLTPAAMSTRQRKRSKLKPLLAPGGSLLLLAYFAYHAVEGEYGLAALNRLLEQETRLAAELVEVREDRAALEARVELMRPESLDPDMIDERARQALNLAHPQDIVIFLPQAR